jgi:hypothetical protein
MLDFFAAVPGKLKVLTDRLSSARAGYLDNLNTNLAVLPAPASTALSTAQWTNARAGYLDALNGGIAQENTPILDVPIASGIVGSDSRTLSGSLATMSAGLATSSTTGTSYSDAVNYTGEGVLCFAAVQTTANSVAAYMTITIDGVSMGEVTATAAQYKITPQVGALTIGASPADPTGIAFEAIPFKTSLQIQKKAASTGTCDIFYKYRKTA